MKKGKNLKTVLVLSLFGFMALGSSINDSEILSEIQDIQKEAASEALNGIADIVNEYSAAVTGTEKKYEPFYVTGDTVTTDSFKIYYAECGEYKSKDIFFAPKEGYKYVYIKLDLENISDSSKIISNLNFKGYADDYEAEQYLLASDRLSENLSPGRKGTGIICFIIPEDTEKFEVEYDPGSNGKTIIKLLYDFENEAESVSDTVTQVSTETEEKPAVSENEEISVHERTSDAIEVGTSSETRDLKITYLSCEDYTEYEKALAPKAGYKYLSVILEAENISDADLLLSNLNFSCYADGNLCSKYFFRNDELSAALAPGDKTNGSVTFIVPEDAEVIEAFYRDDLIGDGSGLVFKCK